MEPPAQSRPPRRSGEPWVASLLQRIAADIPLIVDPEERAGLFLGVASVHHVSREPDLAESHTDRAQECARLVAPDNITPLLWPRLVDARLRHNQRARARETARAGAIAARQVPDPDTCWWMAGTLVERLTALGDQDTAHPLRQWLAETQPQRHAGPDGHQLAARIALAAKDPSTALLHAVRLPRTQRVAVFVAASTQLRSQGNRDRGERSLRDAWEQARSHSDPDQRGVDQARVLEEMVRQGRTIDALRWAKTPGLKRTVVDAALATPQRKIGLANNPAATPNLVYAWSAEGKRDKAHAAHREVLARHGWFLDDDPVRMLAARAVAEERAGNPTGAEGLVADALAWVEQARGMGRQTRLRIALAEALRTGGWRIG